MDPIAFVKSLNFAQWFMFYMFVGSFGGSVGFMMMGKVWTGVIWMLYSLANIGWFMVASGKA